MPEEKAALPGGADEAPVPSKPPPEAPPRKKRPPRPPKMARVRMFLLGMSLFAFAWLVAAHYVRPAKYTATTIFERRSDAASAEQTSNAPESVQALRLTMEQDLKGFDAVAQAAEDLGLTRGLPHDEQGKLTPAGEARKQELVQELAESTSVTRVESPAVDRVSVSFTGADPRLVQQLPDMLVHNYINKASSEIVDRLTASKVFLAKQVEDRKRRMQELTASLIEFETQHPDILPDAPGTIRNELLKVPADSDSIRQQYLSLKSALYDQGRATELWQERLTEVEMALAAEVAYRRTHLDCIQAAQPQYRPESPELWAVLVIALMGGVLTGVGCAVRPIQFSPRGRLLLTLAILVLALATGLSTLSSVLRLEYPEEYAKWKAAPMSYLAGKVTA